MERLVQIQSLVAREMGDACGAVVVRGRQDDLIEARVVQAGYKAQVDKDGVDKYVTVTRTTIKTIESFLQQPKYVILRVRVTWWRSDDNGFISGKVSVSESVLAVALIEDLIIFCGHSCEDTQERVLRHGSVLHTLLLEVAFEVAKDDNARLGAV